MASNVTTIETFEKSSDNLEALKKLEKLDTLDDMEDHTSKICEELNVDPRCVGFCIGKHRVNLRRVGNEVYQKTGTTVYIKYVTPPGYEWGFFKIISRSQDGIEIAKIEIKKMESEFLELIRDGKMTPLRKKHIHEIKAWNPEYNQQKYKNFNRTRECGFHSNTPPIHPPGLGFTAPINRIKYNNKPFRGGRARDSDTKLSSYRASLESKEGLRIKEHKEHEDFCWNGDSFESC
jgi:hypothetical protein